MDFEGRGTLSTRTLPFENDVTIITTPLPTVTFNWRGRTSACTLSFTVQNSPGEQSWVDVSDAGDVTVNSSVDVLPNANYATVNSNSDVDSTAVVSGSAVHNNTVDCTGDGSSPPGPPISGGRPGCKRRDTLQRRRGLVGIQPPARAKLGVRQQPPGNASSRGEPLSR